jgi:hypothetical protein
MHRILPRRFRGLPPLFYLMSSVGILWGAAFLFLRVSRQPIPAGMTLEPAPPLPNPILDVIATAMAAVGVAQGVGTLYRRRWGLAAAYASFVMDILWQWLVFELLPDYSPADTICNASALLVYTAILVALIIYYHNRRQWFGVAGGPQPS